MARKREFKRGVAARQAARQQRVRQLRTNREDERRLLMQFLEALEEKGGAPQWPIVSVYGVGGVGKSTLLRWVWDEFCERHPDHRMHAVHLDIDSDKAEAMSVVEFFWFMRMQIHQQLQEPLLAFDYVYLKYLEKVHEKIPFSDGPIQQFVDRIARKDSVLSGLLGGVGNIIQSLPVGAVLNSALAYVRDSAREKTLMQQLGIDLAEIDDWTTGDIELLLPQLMAEDLGLLLLELNRPLLLIVDGYERLSDKTEQSFVESFTAGLLLDEVFATRAGMVLLGREPTDWSAYDDPADTQRWNSDFIMQMHLRGFSGHFADQYLAAACTHYRACDQASLADALVRYATDIKEACRETQSQQQPTYHPFYLDICLNTLESRGEDFDPQRHLGLTPKELMNRFFKYMDRDELSLHLVLSLAVHFNWPLVHDLQRQGVIRAWTQTEFLQYVARHSYITDSEASGAFHFNRLMQESLTTYMRTLDEVQRHVLRDSAFAALRDFFTHALGEALQEGQRETAALWLDHTAHMLMQVARVELLPVSDVYELFCQLAAQGGGLLLERRLSWNRAWTVLLRDMLGPDHVQTRKSFDVWADSLESLIARGRAVLQGHSPDHDA